MTNINVTIPANSDNATASHSIGHTNYDVVPLPLALGDVFQVSAKTASSFLLTTNNVDMENDRTFTCIVIEYGTPALGTAYCLASDVEALSQIAYTQLGYADNAAFENALTTLFIPMAQQIIDSYVDHNFLSNTATALLLDGSGKRVLMIQPPYVPVLTVSEVLINGVNVTANIKAYETYLAYQGGVFTEDYSSRKNVSLTFTYGYAAVPSDVRFVCAQITANILADMLRRKLMPDTVARAMQSNSDTVIISGMTKSTVILTPELQSVLDKYRFSCLDVT